MLSYIFSTWLDITHSAPTISSDEPPTANVVTPAPTPRDFNNGVIEGRRIAEEIWVANGSDCGYIFLFQRDVNA